MRQKLAEPGQHGVGASTSLYIREEIELSVLKRKWGFSCIFRAWRDAWESCASSSRARTSRSRYFPK